MLCLHHMHHGFSWWYIGDSLQADRRFHVCRRGGGRGETMPARQTRGGDGPWRGLIEVTEGYGGRREGLIRLEKAGQEGEVAESHSEMFGR
jgi:hypothetical protein